LIDHVSILFGESEDYILKNYSLATIRRKYYNGTKIDYERRGYKIKSKPATKQQKEARAKYENNIMERYYGGGKK
jgi:hypothetical protein